MAYPVPSKPASSLAELRAARGLSQNALAALAGVGASTISRIEARPGHAPQPAVVRRLCTALAVPPGAVAEFRDVAQPVVARPRVRSETRSRSRFGTRRTVRSVCG